MNLSRTRAVTIVSAIAALAVLAVGVSGQTRPACDPDNGGITLPPGFCALVAADNLGPDGRFLSADALRERFAALGIDGEHPVGAYCGSGVTAAHEVAALAIAGIDASLYPGSFSQWSRRPERPVATGATPEGDAPTA